MVILLKDMIDDEVDKRDIGEISTSDKDEEAVFRLVLNKFKFVL